MLEHHLCTPTHVVTAAGTKSVTPSCVCVNACHKHCSRIFMSSQQVAQQIWWLCIRRKTVPGQHARGDIQVPCWRTRGATNGTWRGSCILCGPELLPLWSSFALQLSWGHPRLARLCMHGEVWCAVLLNAVEIILMKGGPIRPLCSLLVVCKI